MYNPSIASPNTPVNTESYFGVWRHYDADEARRTAPKPSQHRSITQRSLGELIGDAVGYLTDSNATKISDRFTL